MVLNPWGPLVVCGTKFLKFVVWDQIPKFVVRDQIHHICGLRAAASVGTCALLLDKVIGGFGHTRAEEVNLGKGKLG